MDEFNLRIALVYGQIGACPLDQQAIRSVVVGVCEMGTANAAGGLGGGRGESSTAGRVSTPIEPTMHKQPPRSAGMPPTRPGPGTLVRQ